MSRLVHFALASSLLFVACKKKETAPPEPVPAMAPEPALATPTGPAAGPSVRAALVGALSDMEADQLRGSGCREIEVEPGARWAVLGPRTVGCMLLGQLGWSQAAELGGRFPFVSGPHNVQDGLRFDAVDDFGHYDPAFATLVTQVAGALAEELPAGAPARRAFERLLRPLARTLFVAELELTRDPSRFQHELAVYREELAARRPYSPLDRYGDYLERSPLWPLLRDREDASDSLTIAPAVAFWLRRELDGTHATFAGGLERVLRAWDAEFVAQAKGLAAPVRPAQAAWSQGQVHSLLRRTWERLDAIQRDVGDPGEGVRGAWRWLYPAAEWLWTGAAAGLPPFLSGQENGQPLDLRKPHSFGRYDPRFVAWLRETALRSVGGGQPGAPEQAAYEQHLAPIARSFWVAWVAYQEDPVTRDRDLQAFKAGLGAKTLPVDWYRELEVPVGSTAPARAARAGHRTPLKVGPEAQAFWLRRLVDGTASDFAAGLQALLTAFDAKFLEAMTVAPPDAGALAPDAQVTAAPEPVPAPAPTAAPTPTPAPAPALKGTLGASPAGSDAEAPAPTPPSR